MRLAWLTDIHLNFVKADVCLSLWEALDRQCDAVVVTGDIGERPSIVGYLRQMEVALKRPIYFVLGNHDFYRGSIAETREVVTKLAAESDYLEYLTATGMVELTPQTALIGHDGWGDARLGDFENSDVILNDYALIEDLQFWVSPGELDKIKLRDVLYQLGDDAAIQLEANLTMAASDYANVIVATHVPPFREATWHEDRISDDNWLPHFSCGATGEAVLRVMRSNPESRLQVLCGHTHGGGEFQPLENVNVLTGPATYGAPAIQRIFDIA
jgi:Icc protein